MSEADRTAAIHDLVNDLLHSQWGWDGRCDSVEGALMSVEARRGFVAPDLRALLDVRLFAQRPHVAGKRHPRDLAPHVFAHFV